jgi:hypothetical protein
MTEHPITPPPKLVKKWIKSARYREFMPYPEGYEQYEQRLTTIAARWGADMELEACCEWLDQKVLLQHQSDVIPALRAARRPKPPSKEEALDELYISFDRGYLKKEAADIIRRALEQLDD